MGKRVIAAVAGIIAVTSILGIRAAALGFTARLDGLDRLTRTRPAPAASPDDIESIEDYVEADSIEAAESTPEEAPFEPVLAPVDERASTKPAAHSECQDSMLVAWNEWWTHAIAYLPEHLRDDSEHRQALDAVYREAVSAFLEPAQVLALIGSGFVTPEVARFTTYNLRAQTFHTLLRMDPMTRVVMEDGAPTVLDRVAVPTAPASVGSSQMD